MFRNYLKIAFRTFLKRPSYLIINLLGLSIGIACCIVAYMFFEYNANFDKMHGEKENIFRIHLFANFDGSPEESGTVHLPLKDAVVHDIPGIKRAIRHQSTGFRVKAGGNLFSQWTTCVDPGFFEIFSFPVVYGNPKGIVEENTVVLSQSTAQKYFGDEYPIGKEIEIISSQKSELFKVIAVLKDIPLNTSFTFDMLVPFANYLEYGSPNGEKIDESSWVMSFHNVGTFIELNSPQNKEAVEQQLQKYVKVSNEINPTMLIESFGLQPFATMAERSTEISGSTTNRTFSTVNHIIFGSMALLILLIACFNFTNTTIALSGNRLKEIGIRKAMGSLKSQLIKQFMLENIIICMLALILSLALAELLLPQFNLLWGVGFEINYKGNILLFSFLGGILLVTAIIAGSYPALYMSRPSPSETLRGSSQLKGSNFMINGLLVFQFGLSMIGIIAGFVLYSNSKYIENFDIGYNTDDIIWLNARGKYELLKQEVLNHPDIISYGTATQHIGHSGYEIDVLYNDSKLRVRALGVGKNYLKTMGIQIVLGSDYNYESITEQNTQLIVSEEFVKRYGIQDPIGKIIRYENLEPQKQIIGVVKDFRMRGVFSKVEPMIIEMRPKETANIIAVKSRPGRINEVNQAMKASWEAILPEIEYESIPQDWIGTYAKEFNGKMTKMFLFLSAIATILSCIGLFALVNLIINKKVKEIGIRKVLGATIQHILYTINRQFLVVLGIAVGVGFIASHYVLNYILDIMFENNHVKIGVWPFIAGFIIIITVSVLTVGKRVYNAATANPIRALKYE